MLDILLTAAIIFQASAIALGVGSSTITIISFLTALKDGTIDEGERRMLGVDYWSLRAAMFGIVLTTGFISGLHRTFLDPIETYVWLLVVILFANAFGMTKHWISMKVGPALQAATWYTLGFLATIHLSHLFAIDNSVFVLLYLTDIVIALVLVNGFMAWRTRHTKG